VILVLLGTRVHYSIDIVGAIILTVWLFWILTPNIIYFDQCFSVILISISKAIKAIKHRAMNCILSWHMLAWDALE